MPRLAILASHPIYYQTSLFEKINKESNLDLCVYFYNKPSSYDEEFGLDVEWNIPLLKGYDYKFLNGPFSIFKELKRNDYDAIIIHGWDSFANWSAFLAAFIFKTPIFLRGENPLNQELLKPKWKIKIKKIVLGRLFRRISAFLYIGEENKKFYRFYGVPEGKLFFAPYAVDNERFITASKELKAKRKLFRKESGINDKAIVILFVGKLIDKKRSMDLLMAYGKLKTEIALVLVGNGALYPELENYAQEHNLENVHFVGFKNQTELPKYYALADIFILPSGLGETWGLVVNEAMCFSLPMIVSDMVGCGPDLIKNEENGYIFPVGNIEKLTEHLASLIENPEKRKKFGEKSFEIIQDYSYENDIKGILMALKN